MIAEKNVKSDPTSRAHLAAAVALSNPLHRPTVGLEGLEPGRIAGQSWHLGTAAAVVSGLERLGLNEGLSDRDVAAYPATLAFNMLALDAASETLDALERAGLRCAPFKGSAFLLDMYADDIGQRRMMDLDVLLDAPTFTPALAPLEALGWRRTLKAPVSSRVHCEATFEREIFGFKIVLELHRRLVMPARFSIDHGGLWHRARRNKDGGWRLDPVDVLLYLALHKALHGYCNDCRDLVDATNLVQSDDIDWTRLVQTAADWSCSAATALFLRRARRAFGLRVEDGVLAALDPPGSWRVALERAMPDATLEPAFVQRDNPDRALGQRIVAGLLMTDKPHTEALAYAGAALRVLADRAARPLERAGVDFSFLEDLPLP